jgi:hypothetical protein
LFGFVLLLPFGLILLAFFVAHRVTPFWLGPLQFSTSPGSGHLFRGQHIRPPKCSRTLQYFWASCRPRGTSSDTRRWQRTRIRNQKSGIVEEKYHAYLAEVSPRLAEIVGCAACP